MGGRHQRPHFILFAALLQARPDAQLRDQRLQFGDQFVGGIVTDHHGDRQRHAALAGRAERAAHQRVDRGVQIGVRHDDRLILRRAEGLHPLAVRAGGGVDMFRHGG